MKDSFNDHKLSGTHPSHFFNGKPIISDQVSREGLGVVWREFAQVIAQNVPGDIVEFGCYAGTTSLFIRRLLNEHPQTARAFHVYDSFAGLPEKSQEDSNAAGVDFEAGKLYVSKQEFIQIFRKHNLALPYIHKGWFNELPPSAVPETIACAFLDGDFYGSIIDSLTLVWPKMSPGGVVLIDDYQRETLPGVERAIRDFFKGSIPPVRAEHNIAILHKP